MTPTDAQRKQVWEYSKEELAEKLAIALCEIDRLTAAAEVGDKCANCGGDPNVRAWVSVDLHREVKSATIERCAQMALAWDEPCVAAAIRALKDKEP